MKGNTDNMNKLEMIELEPYEAPALEELKHSVLRGQDEGISNPAGDDEIPGGDDPLPDF